MKIYYQGKLVRDSEGRFTSFKRKMFWFGKKVVIGWSMGIILLVTYGAGLSSTTSFIPTVEAETNVPPILQKIAKCESPAGHWKNGQVIISLNTNGTYDEGKYQINSIWNKQAAELGYNLAIEQDNEKMAEWIYANRGTGDWSSSANCWRK